MTQMTVEQALATAVQLHQAGRLPEADAIYRQIIGLDPTHADAIHLLGVIAHQQGRQQEAHDLITRAIHLKPMLPPYHCNLGLVLGAMGRRDEAIECYRRASRLGPRFAAAHYNLGVALAGIGSMREAIAPLLTATQLDPNLVDGFFTLGNACLVERQIPESIAAYRQALALRPDHADTYNNLGAALRINLQTDEAILAFEKCLALRPNFADAHNNLGNVLKDMGDLDGALQHFDQALAIQPNSPGAAGNRLYTLHFHPRYSGKAILQEQRKWNNQFAAPLKPAALSFDQPRDPSRRLRIGYVSPDFRKHVVGQNLLPLFENHDHSQFEIFAYASVVNPDAMTAQFQAKSDTWRNLLGMSDEAAAQLIREDRIDILVDLSLHMANNRILIFARKPAPIQATFGGYPAGTGLATMDYRISDQYLDPAQFDSHYVERTIRLPDSFWCYDPVAMGVAAEPQVNPLPALRNGFITFGCLNNFCKVNDTSLLLWTRVMAAVPDSHLLLMSPPGKTRERIAGLFQQQGIDESRLQFVDRQDQGAYFYLYHEIDIGLDTLPYNGHTTTLDSLWMGVPVVTLLGKTAVGRAGWSQYCNLKLRKLAVQTPEKFIELAAQLSKDLPRLGELRASLRHHMQQSPLTSGTAFARNIEAAYRQMWTQWCAGAESAK